MAVLVRSGRNSIPGLRRALGAAGVPVEVASDDVPLVRDPAVLPMLDALRAVLNLDNEDRDHVEYVDPGRAEALLMGPLGGLDAGDVRRLGRDLRAREKVLAHEAGTPARPSRELLRAAVVQDDFLDGVSGAGRRAGPGAAHPPEAARAELDAGVTAEQVLWTLWSGTSWPHRLRRAVAAGGGSARRANRDLDSLVALFDVAARAEEQRDHVGVRNFLATLVAQQIPADTLSERGVRGPAVRLLTAHRSKGLEWRLVVVAHVQAEGWPDLRRRSTLLQADRIGSDGLVPPVTATGAAARGAPAVLRRVHACPAAPGGDGRGVARGRRRAAVPLPRRPGRRPVPRQGAAEATPLPARSGERAAPHGDRSGHQRGAAGRSCTPARPARPGERRPAAARADGRPRHLVGHEVAEPVRAPGARPGPARSRCRRACSSQ